MTKIDRLDELDGLTGVRWGEDELYVTEFHDFASPDGLYRKWRIAVVAGQALLRHVVIGDAWLLHAERRGAGPEVKREEERHIRERDFLADRVQDIVGVMYDRLGLDYFGVDFTLLPDGTMLLFEANACMDILRNSQPPPNMWEAPIGEITEALTQLLLAPERWVHGSR